MPNTTHDDAPTWARPGRPQLTPAQIERLTGMEQRSRMPADETAAALLEGAREWARSNLTGRVMFAHLPKPAGAERVFGWEDDGDGRWSRRFDGTRRGFQQVSVDIVGVQWADGMVERYVYIDAHGVELPAAAARDLADSLIAAADELDRQTD